MRSLSACVTMCQALAGMSLTCLSKNLSGLALHLVRTRAMGFVCSTRISQYPAHFLCRKARRRHERKGPDDIAFPSR